VTYRNASFVASDQEENTSKGGNVGGQSGLKIHSSLFSIGKKMKETKGHGQNFVERTQGRTSYPLSFSPDGIEGETAKRDSVSQVRDLKIRETHRKFTGQGKIKKVDKYPRSCISAARTPGREPSGKKKHTQHVYAVMNRTWKGRGVDCNREEKKALRFWIKVRDIDRKNRKKALPMLSLGKRGKK